MVCCRAALRNWHFDFVRRQGMVPTHQPPNGGELESNTSIYEE